jgi:alpha-beta hydrolase superfamily lysophospholipase
MDDEAERPPKRRRRWPWWAGGAAAVLLLLFFAGGGWYFSSKIRSDALVVNDQEAPEYLHEVLEVGEGLIVLALGDDPPRDLTADEIVGIRWPAGYGHADAIVEQDDTRVVRSFRVIEGAPPPVGDPIALDGYAYPEDPAAISVPPRCVACHGDGGFTVPPPEEVSYASAFGEFGSLLFDGSDDTWVVFVHGRGAHVREGFRMLPVTAALGYPSILIGYRNDEGEPSTGDRLGTFGVEEWEDLEGAVRFALDRGAADVVLAGASMGGAIVVSFLEQSALADRVAGIVLDAPALELGAMVDARAGDTALLPGLPMKVPTALTATAKTISSWRFGVDWGAIDYLDRIGEIAVPVLLFHGTDDTTVPVALSDEAAETLGDRATYVRVDGAEHVRAWNADPVGYSHALAEFLDAVG